MTIRYYRKMNRKKRKQKDQFGMLFWLAIILLIIIIFLSNRKNIDNALRATKILDLLTRNQQNEEKVTNAKEEHARDTTQDINPPIIDVEKHLTEAIEALERAQHGIEETPTVKESEPPASAEAPIVKRSAEPEQTTKAALYFISVNEEGDIIPIRVFRQTKRSAAPMTQSINLLLKGVTDTELEDGLLNLIPPNSVLLSASIKNEIAYLNFNEEFRFNPLGQEGIAAQIKQIVYSVTEFDTITQVQFMVDGQTIDYLNSESNIYLGRPIGREFFG